MGWGLLFVVFFCYEWVGGYCLLYFFGVGVIVCCIFLLGSGVGVIVCCIFFVLLGVWLGVEVIVC